MTQPANVQRENKQVPIGLDVVLINTRSVVLYQITGPARLSSVSHSAPIISIVAQTD